MIQAIKNLIKEAVYEALEEKSVLIQPNHPTTEIAKNDNYMLRSEVVENYILKSELAKKYIAKEELKGNKKIYTLEEIKKLLADIESKNETSVNKPTVKQDTKTEIINEFKDEPGVFYVKRSEFIHEIAKQQANLPTGPCTIELIGMNNQLIKPYINNKIRKVTTENRHVFYYFNSPDTTMNDIKRFKIIHAEMNEKGKEIETIKVIVTKSI